MNLHALRARRAAAEAIISHLWDTLSPEARTDPETVQAFRSCESKRVRNIFAREAGQTATPSDQTWRIAARILARRVRDARWGAGLTERAS